MAQNVYTVRQVNAYIKNMFNQDYMLSHIYVKGEVSNCKYHSSGHIYFSLKDESGTIACVLFAGQRGGLSFHLSEGQQVVVLGSISVYERTGAYQLYAKEIHRDGEGLLYERFLALKKELEEMGMFAPEYKKPIPAFARTVGVVTAPTGAAVRDIINISHRRNPYVQLILYPAQVQGEGAAKSVVEGIRRLGDYGVDVLIVGRGGGSMEDLMAFNEESVARAIFDCPVPVISAVGHETDTTIADYVADLRAPTPSAAAELAVYDYYQFSDTLLDRRKKLTDDLRQTIRMKRAKLTEYETKVNYLHPRNRIRDARMRLSEYEIRLSNQHPSHRIRTDREKLTHARERLDHRMQQRLDQAQHRLDLCTEKIKAVSPLDKLKRGYAYVEQRDGKALTNTGQVQAGDALSVYVTDGVVDATVVDTREEYHG